MVSRMYLEDSEIIRDVEVCAQMDILKVTVEFLAVTMLTILADRYLSMGNFALLTRKFPISGSAPSKNQKSVNDRHLLDCGSSRQILINCHSEARPGLCVYRTNLKKLSFRSAPFARGICC